MIKRALRSTPSRKVLLTLDGEANKLLPGARERNGRTKADEALVRLQDHLQRYPDFYNEEIFREVIEENESTSRELQFSSANINQRNHMNTVLSVQGASTPVEKKSFFSKFIRLSMLHLVRTVIPVTVLMMLFPGLAMTAGKGADLMTKGQEMVRAAFGKNSSIVRWVALAEVLAGTVTYMTVKNVKFLVGSAMLSMFITVDMSVTGF